jgi:hypothetical protein
VTPFYVILSIAGWIWFVVLGGYIIRARRQSAERGSPRKKPTDGTKSDA